MPRDRGIGRPCIRLGSPRKLLIPSFEFYFVLYYAFNLGAAGLVLPRGPQVDDALLELIQCQPIRVVNREVLLVYWAEVVDPKPISRGTVTRPCLVAYATVIEMAGEGLCIAEAVAEVEV
jgi:hypothetical protein